MASGYRPSTGNEFSYGDLGHLDLIYLHLNTMQYAENFAGALVDARLLEHLSKKDLEKYLGVTRKFHLAAIAHGQFCFHRVIQLIPSLRSLV